LPNDIALDAAPAARPVTFSTWFNSDATWPVDGGVSHAMPVCLGAGVPSSCPTTGPVVHYNFPASGWAANLAFIPYMQWIWDGAQIAENNAPENDEFHTAKFFDLPDCARGGGSFWGYVLIVADDFAQVFVNGGLVGEVGSTTDPAAALAAQQNVKSFTFDGLLAPGLNVVEIRAVNGDWGVQNASYSANPAGVAFGGTLGCLGPN
jgi:hypothetical protein